VAIRRRSRAGGESVSVLSGGDEVGGGDLGSDRLVQFFLRPEGS